MEVLLKKEVCGSIEQCTRPTGISQKLLKHVSQKKKEKKKKEMQTLTHRKISPIQTVIYCLKV